MLIDKHECYNILFDLQSSGIATHEDISRFMKERDYIPKCVINYLIEQNNPTIEFYKLLNNKAHKIIKEILTCENKTVSTYIKIASSLITQATITLEHTCQDDIDKQNELIKNLHLKELTHGLNIYFSTGNYRELVDVVLETRNDIKAILDD